MHLILSERITFFVLATRQGRKSPSPKKIHAHHTLTDSLFFFFLLGFFPFSSCRIAILTDRSSKCDESAKDDIMMRDGTASFDDDSIAAASLSYPSPLLILLLLGGLFAADAS